MILVLIRFNFLRKNRNIMMKKILGAVAIATTLLAASHADQGDALKQTEINLQGVSVNQNDAATLKSFNEQPTLVKRAEFLSTNLYGKPNHLLDGLPEDPFQRITFLVNRVNAAKNLWVKTLEAREATNKLLDVAKATGASHDLGEIAVSKS
jgi:hypothetical protein